MKEETDSDKWYVKTWFIVLLFIFMITLWAVSGVLINYFARGIPDVRGTFGDMFGAVNALFSGAVLAGVIYTLIIQKIELRLQRQELKLQRQELKLTREELGRSAEAQEKSAQLSAYTSLLDTYNQSALYIHEAMEKRRSPELEEQYRNQIKERDYYASKVAELVGEDIPERNITK